MNIFHYSKTITLKTSLVTNLFKIFIQPFILRKNSKKKIRFLEIGPGNSRIENFETLNVVKNEVSDFVGDATNHLPFHDNSFDLVYASHILEHVPWYQVQKILEEWKRVIKPGGYLEIWVPDGLKIAKAFVAAEEGNDNSWQQDNWYRFNEKHDPGIWFSARMFSYGDGSGDKKHPNWHLSTFSYRLLEKMLRESGFEEIRRLTHSECRGFDHGWINMGIRGRKP